MIANEPRVGTQAASVRKEALTDAAPTLRRCVVCLVEVRGWRALYCEPHRLEARRKSWRESKRRHYPMKGIYA